MPQESAELKKVTKNVIFFQNRLDKPIFFIIIKMSVVRGAPCENFPHTWQRPRSAPPCNGGGATVKKGGETVGEVLGSAICAATGTAAAVTTGNDIVVIVTSICNGLILLANCAVTIYRKWRDRDKDLAVKDEEEKKEDGNGTDTAE